MQLKSSDFLLNIRLCFSSIILAHLVFAAIILLPIDMSQDEDPRISAYSKLKWKLLTCWFNLLMLVYFPVSIYCDWAQKQGKWNDKRVKTLRNAKDILMTSILFPTIMGRFPLPPTPLVILSMSVGLTSKANTKIPSGRGKADERIPLLFDRLCRLYLFMYSDYFFWRMWYQDPSLIAPIKVFEYMPSWGQHSLHTVSGFTVLLDILLTPRRRPDSILPGSIPMFAFCALYSLVLTVSYYNGDVVYSVVHIFNKQQIILLITLAFIEHIFFYTLQWCIIDAVHGRQAKIIKKST